ncbi:MAG: hypothetical protein WCJ62_08415 [Flavobacterium sp.]
MKTEPNKLEIQFKEQLNAREIQPSEMAWDRLDAMLSVAEEKKTTRSPFLSLRFIGIAASILVLVSLGLFFFNTKENVAQPNNNVVVKDKINNNDKINENNLNSSIQNQQVVAIKNQQSKTSNQKSASQSFNPSANRPIINQKTPVNVLINSNQEAVAQKVLPIESSEKELSSKTSTVNVDALLASVEKTSKLNASSKIKVNASSLLSQVDGELDQSFRDKVLRKINRNYKEVKVALAGRNQE